MRFLCTAVLHFLECKIEFDLILNLKKKKHCRKCNSSFCYVYNDRLYIMIDTHASSQNIYVFSKNMSANGPAALLIKSRQYCVLVMLFKI
jgi:hypothetical protein